MPLLEELTRIVADGLKQARRILASPHDRHRVRLQTQEFAPAVLDPLPPANATAAPAVAGRLQSRLILGDNLLAMTALLQGDEDTPGLLGRIDVIYIEPPLVAPDDATASGRRTTIVSFARQDRPTQRLAPGLAALVPRLVLMRELLAETGCLYIRLGSPVSHYVKVVLDEIFGRDHFMGEVICSGDAAGTSGEVPPCDYILRYAKGAGARVAPVSESSEREPLLERLIAEACPSDGIVADFYAGSGTTAVVAERLGRPWIIADASRHACNLVRERLGALQVRPYLQQTVVEQREAPDVVPIRAADRNPRGDAIDKALKAYGASPLPHDEDPVGNLGAASPQGVRTLVRVDSPCKLTGEASVRRAIAQLNDGWDRVVVLGWNFEPALSETLLALRHPQLDVLAIRPALLDEPLGEIPEGGSDRFFSARHLGMQPIRRWVSPMDEATEMIEIALDAYVVLSPDAIGLNANEKARLAKAMKKDRLALIEYWAVDPDYDGSRFHAAWRVYRGTDGEGNDYDGIVAGVRLEVPARKGIRRVCIHAMDAFGAEIELMQNVPVQEPPVEEPAEPDP